MKFFIDTSDLTEVRSLASSGLLDGVTTNPSLIAKSRGKLVEMIAQICDIVSGPEAAKMGAYVAYAPATSAAATMSRRLNTPAR